MKMKEKIHMLEYVTIKVKLGSIISISI